MMKLLSHRTMRHLHYWLPYIIASLVTLISIVLWYCIIFNESLIPSLSLKTSLPWIILILGLLSAALFAIAIRLNQISKQRSHSLDTMNQDFRQEMLEHMRSEKSKQELEKALLQSQKLQAVGTLASGIAHDFNNILYAIIGYTELAQEDLSKDSLPHSNLGKVLEASHRGKELIGRLLDFSRRQRHDTQPIHLKAIIEGVLGLLKPTIPSSVIVNFEAPDWDCTIMGNMTQLHQVIVNIINNAVDAMDREGAITISLALVEPNDPLLNQLPNITKTHYCKIDINDTGHGMDPTTMERIFEPFFTTKEVGKGTGLGLSAVHTIMTEHSGGVMVTSQPGQGATFTLLLPRYMENDYGNNSIS
jgi:signal transduction histidine kinase